MRGIPASGRRALRHPLKKLPYYDRARDCYCVPVGGGKVTLIDPDDLPRVVTCHWSLDSWGYVQGYTGGRLELLSRFIVNAPHGMMVDHKNRNRLDNRKENLRICTTSQNNSNSAPHAGTTSRFKGVTWKKSNAKWCAQITVKGESRYLGLFESEEEAARAYDAEAIREFGEFARANFSD